MEKKKNNISVRWAVLYFIFYMISMIIFMVIKERDKVGYDWYAYDVLEVVLKTLAFMFGAVGLAASFRSESNLAWYLLMIASVLMGGVSFYYPDILVAALKIFILLIPLIKPLSEKISTLKWICFAPVVLYMLFHIRTLFSIYTVSSTISMVFMCLWSFSRISETVSIREKNSAQKKMGCSLIGSADNIMELKRLMDSGLITQEEFNSRKKDILIHT